MNTPIFLYDDARARAFEPFASTRPVSEMRAGVWLMRERAQFAFGAERVFFIAGERHADFDEPGAMAAAGVVPAGAIVVNSRFAPATPAEPWKAARSAASCSLWRHGNDLVAVRLKNPVEVKRFEDGSLDLEQLDVGTGSIGTLDGWWMRDVWDFIRHLPEQLTSDITRSYQAASQVVNSTTIKLIPYDALENATVIGTNPIVVSSAYEVGDEQAKTIIEPHVILDATSGPISIGPGTHIHAFSRITGPCYIGRDVQVMGGDITGCSIGDVSKVRGELSGTIVLGHSNKGHDGFVGHSYLGRWVNLGASTVTSNLKNTYGTVALWTPSGVRDTGMQFLGTMFGDHVKTGIGLRLTTGCVLGAGANVFDQMPPKVVAPFSWGGKPPYETYQSDKFVETARRMMARRHVELSDRARRHLLRVYAGRWTAENTKA